MDCDDNDVECVWKEHDTWDEDKNFACLYKQGACDSVCYTLPDKTIHRLLEDNISID